MRMYFIAVVLPPELDNKVRSLKEYMRDKYGCKVTMRSPAHITIIPPFWMDPMMEEELNNGLTALADRLAPVEIHHDGFSSFPQKTIFIDVHVSRELGSLHQEVNDHFKQKPQFGMKFDSRPFHPHVTIATRDLHKRSFQEAFTRFKDEKFKETWTCNSLNLLRLSDNGWEVIGTFQLGHKKIPL